jgi:hypothetical protein
MKKLKYGTPIMVLWHDAFMENSKVHSLEDAKKLAALPQSSIGFFISKNKTGIVIASTLCDSDGGTVDGILFIPAAWETKITVLGPATYT